MANSKISELAAGGAAQANDSLPAARGAGNVSLAVSAIRAFLPLAMSAGTASVSAGTVAFSDSNGISFGLNGSTVTASHNGLTSQSVQTQSNVQGISAGTQAGRTGDIVFSNSNGITFGMSNSSVVTASHNGLTTARASNDGVGLNTAQSNVTWTVNSSGLSLDARGYAGTGTTFNGTNASASMTLNSNGLRLDLSAAAGGGGGGTISAYAQSNTTQSSSGTMPASSVQFQGNGGVSVGVSNGSVVLSAPGTSSLSATGAASISVNGSTVSIGVGTVTASATSNTTQGSSGTLNLNGLIFAGAGGASVGISNGSVVISGATGGAGGNFSAGVSTGGNTAGATGITGSQLVLVGSNNISLSQTTGANGATVSINAPASSSLSATGAVSISTNGSTISIGVGTVTMSATGNTTQASSGTVNLAGLIVNGAGVASAGISNGSIVVSVANAGGADGFNRIAAGTQTAGTLQTVSFVDSNGITFGMSGSSQITASHNGLTTARASNDAIGLNTAQSNVTWTVNSSGLSLDARGYAGTGTSATNASITLNSDGLQISVAAPGGGGGVAVSAGANSVSNGTVVFSNSNGVTFGLNGSTVTASHNGLTSQSNQAVSANNGSYAFQTLSFSNANGISFGTSAGSAITASHNALTTARASTDAVGLNTALTAGPLAWTVNSSGISLNAGSAAGTTSGFAGANISGSITHNTAGINLSLSVAAPGAAAENNNINLLGANTAGNTTASGSTIGISGINVTLSGTNNSVINISAPASSSLVGAGGISISTNGSTISVQNITLSGYLEPLLDRELLAAQIGNTQLWFQPLRLRNNVQFDEIVFPCNWSNASNSSNSGTLTLSVGFYTRTGNSLSYITSSSSSFAVTASGTVGSYSIFGGPREYPIPFTTTLTIGDYYLGFISRTTTGGGAGMTWSNFVASNINSAYSGRFSSANNATNQWVMGMGSYTAGTTGFPNSVALSQINGSAAVNLRPLAFKLASGDLN